MREPEPYFRPGINALAQVRISCLPKSSPPLLVSLSLPVTVTRLSFPPSSPWPTRLSPTASSASTTSTHQSSTAPYPPPTTPRTHPQSTLRPPLLTILFRQT